MIEYGLLVFFWISGRITKNMELSVIIVSWNAKEYLRQCLQSIQKFTVGVDYEIIVVDNASHDGSAAMVKAEFPGVRLLSNVRNVGFARANNQGAEIARGEWLFFCNDDVFLTENSLKVLLEKCRHDPQQMIGIIGCHLLFPDGTHQDSVRREPTLRDQILILTKLHHLVPYHPALQHYLAADMDYSKEQDVDQVMGACMMMSKHDFMKLHGFDEKFFLWFEEVDLQRRVRTVLRKRVVYTPATCMVHAKSKSFQQLSSVTNQRRFNASLHWYFQKHVGRKASAVISIMQPLSIVLAMLVTFSRLWQQLRTSRKHQTS